MGTNIDGKRKVMFAMTSIKGVGRRYANIVLKKADVDLDKRAGECSEEEVEKIITIMTNPRQYKIPDWFLNRQKDIIDGKYSQVNYSFIHPQKLSHAWVAQLNGAGKCSIFQELVACAKSAGLHFHWTISIPFGDFITNK